MGWHCLRLLLGEGGRTCLGGQGMPPLMWDRVPDVGCYHTRGWGVLLRMCLSAGSTTGQGVVTACQCGQQLLVMTAQKHWDPGLQVIW